MYCSNCGEKCLEGARFCIKCGQRLIYPTDETLKREPDTVPEPPQTAAASSHQSNDHLLHKKEETFQKTNFLAGIFFALHGILLLYYTLYGYQQILIHRFVGFRFFTWKTWMTLFLLFASILLLFLKKIKPLAVTLLIYCIWNMGNCIYEIYLVISVFLFSNAPYDVFLNGMFAFSYFTLALLTIAILIKENPFSSAVKKFWYIPGILICLGIIIGLFHDRRITHFLFIDLCLAAESFFAGWWLTTPYKKDSKSTASGISNPNDASSFGYAALGFFIPIVGLVLYLIWKDQMPLRAKSAGKGALVSVIAATSIGILIFLLPDWRLSALLQGYY